MILIAGLQIKAADERKWHVGLLVDVTRVGKQYDYRLIIGDDRFTGRSSQPLRLTPRTKVKFAIQGKKIYVVDENGETKELRYMLQELMPPAPPPKEP
jgi:negative regulator of sigma E activity